MSLGVFAIQKEEDFDLNSERNLSGEDFLEEISRKMKEDVFITDKDAFKNQNTHIFYIPGGGTEQIFAEKYKIVEGPYYLLTRPSDNSLAAAMEILAFLNERGEKGEIIHGDATFVAQKLTQIIKINTVKARLNGYRLGTNGESSWLISSKADPETLELTSGMKLINIPIEELLDEIAKNSYEDNHFTEEIKSHHYSSEEVERALGVYGAVRRLVDRYQLDGITIRCFDLLMPAKITGCLALAILNAGGIHAACEADSRSLISMTVLGELTGKSVFMANPSTLFPDKNELILAHCILPLNMPDRYELTTHFESGLGVSVIGELPLGPCTIFKCKENFKEYYAESGTILENLRDPNMCRTQIRVQVPNGLSYFTNRPISNHHMVCIGDYKELIDAFFASY